MYNENKEQKRGGLQRVLKTGKQTEKLVGGREGMMVVEIV